jgi:zinc protease
MKKVSLLLTLVIALASVATAQERKLPIAPIGPLPPFHPQEPKRVQLPNGMVIFLQEDHELPIIDGFARIRGGSRSEPAAKTGLAQLYGQTWRTGGTKTQTGDQLDDYLEIRAAKVETGAIADSTIISLSCLKEDFDDTFKIFAALLRQPEFREDKLELAKRRMFDGISRRNDETDDITGREVPKLAYGESNPYARVPEYATVGAVTRQDLLDWYKTYIVPNNIVLGISGDFDSAKMETALRKAFGDWAKGPAATMPVVKFESAKPGYYQIKKEDVNQSSIHLLGLGTLRSNPDYYAIEVFNEAFGGGFASRLFKSIRTDKGLAYGVGGGVGTRFDHPGILQLAMSTKSSTTIESINALYAEIDKLKAHPITDAEIAVAKDAILNAFVFNFDAPDKVMHERMAYEYYGYPADFLERFRVGIEKVTPADVARVAAKYVHKDQLAVLVVGNTAEFDKPLSSLGKVTDVDITIPPPPGKKQEKSGDPPPPETQGSNPEGKAVAAKVAQALGGEDKLKSVKALKTAFALTQLSGGMQGEIQIESTTVFPDRSRIDVQGPQGSFSMITTPDAAYGVAGGEAHELPASRKDENLAQIRRDLVFIAQHVNDSGFSFASAGSDKTGGTETTIVDVSGPGVTMRWFVDPETGKIVRETYKAVGQSGPVDGETAFSDWRASDGLNLPYHRANKQNGQDSSTVQYSNVQINPAVDMKIFEKPASPTQ